MDPANALIVGIWALLTVGFAFCTFVALIVSLILRNRAKHHAVTVLLILATLTIVLVQVSELPFMRSRFTPEVSENQLAWFSITTENTLLTRYLSQKPQYGWLFDIGYPIGRANDVLGYIDEEFRSAISTANDDQSIRVAYAIFLKKVGRDPALAESGAVEGSLKQYVVPALQGTVEEPIRTTAVEFISKTLPPGWLREQGMLMASGKPLGDETAAYEKSAGVIQALVVLTLVFFAIGGIYIAATASQMMQQFSKRAEPNIPLSGRQVLSLTLIALYAGFISSLVLAIVCGDKGNLASSLLLFSSGLTSLITVLVCVSMMVLKPAGLSLKALNLRPPTLSPIGYIQSGIIGYGVVTFVLGIIFIIQQALTGYFESTSRANWLLAGLASMPDPLAMVLMVVAGTVVAPIFEEIVFRGLIYSWLRVRVGVVAGAIISALLFASIHMDVTGFFILFGVGVVLALAYERTGSLLVPMQIHILNNLVWVIFWIVD